MQLPTPNNKKYNLVFDNKKGAILCLLKVVTKKRLKFKQNAPKGRR